jgi:protein involved in polysaccharide export with SLBB domain
MHLHIWRVIAEIALPLSNWFARMVSSSGTEKARFIGKRFAGKPLDVQSRHRTMTAIVNCIVRHVFTAVVLLCFALHASPIAAAQELPGPSRVVTTTSAPPAPMVIAPAMAPAPITDEHYRLGTGDKIKVTVYGEVDLSGEFLVDASGQVQLPLVGQVKAATLTIHEFVAEVTTALKEGYLKDPKVSVEVLNYRPFYIIGEVNKPGEYPYESGLNVLGAIALAGGYTYRANDNDVYVRRVGSTKEESVPANTTTKVNPGDIIRVAERLF